MDKHEKDETKHLRNEKTKQNDKTEEWFEPVLCGYPHPSVKTSSSGSGYQKLDLTGSKC
jgi:hypothetical protein